MSAAKQKMQAKVAAPKEGTILDRGYTRYEGTYTPEASRWGVIARRMLRMSARQWWAILLLIAVVLPTLGAGIVMWLHSKLMAMAPPGAKIEPPDVYVLWIATSAWGTLLIAFLLALFAGAAQVADDARAGAFQFYFARPVTREQYLVGKLVPVLTLVTFVCVLPPLILALLRLALLQNGDEVLHKLPLVGSAIAFGLIEALVLAVPAMAISSLSRRRVYVQGGYATLFLLPWIVGGIFAARLRSPWPSLLSIPTQLENLAYFVYRMPPPENERLLPAWVSAAVLAALVAGSLAILRRRLADVEVIAS